MLLFGSFSEDETCSLLNCIPPKAQKPDERKELPVTPPNPVPVLTFGSFINVSDKQVGFPCTSGDGHPSAIQKGNKELSEKSAPEKLPNLLANGGAHNSDNCRPENEVVDLINFPALQLSDVNSKIDGKSIHEGIKLNGTINNLAHNKEARGKTEVPNLNAQDILPRGLINSGNLCFLNATLQALLACSPFVQLLQGLKNHNIPKVCCFRCPIFNALAGRFCQQLNY